MLIIAGQQSYTYINVYILNILFHYGLSYNIEYCSLFYTVAKSL